MRICFTDHAGFHRGALHVTVTCSALAATAVAVGSALFPPSAAVLAGAVATLALALGHARVVIDPVGDALTAAAADAEPAERALLKRAGTAHGQIARAARGPDGPANPDGRALTAAARQVTLAVADMHRRKRSLGRQLRLARPEGAEGELADLEQKRDTATDPTARAAYTKAAGLLRERLTRADGLDGVVQRLDARLTAAVAELESTALTVATRAELGPGDPPAALTAACDRLRAANTELGAETEALAELAAI